MLKEWPLVAFTILGQMAVGVFLLAGVPLFMSGPPRDAAAHGTRPAVLALIFVLLAWAALISFFHLHHPFRARYALSNLRTSWLSREILFELGFMALIALGAILTWRRPAGDGLSRAVLILAGLAGVLFLVSMSKLYMLPTVPAWNQAYTPASFVLAALTLGAMATELLTGARMAGRSYSGGLMTLSLALIVAEIVLSLLLAPGHGVFGHRPGPSLRPQAGTPRILHLGRLALSTAGLVLVGMALVARADRAATGSGVSGLLAVAFVLVLAGDIAGRFHFYGLVARPGR